MEETAKIILLHLCDKRTFTTVSTATWEEFQLGTVLRDIGPHVEDIVVHAIGQDFGTGFSWRVTGQFSYDGDTWTDFGSQVASSSVTGNSVSSAYNTRTDFGRHIRFKVGAQSTASGTTGTVSLMVAIKFWS